MIVDVSDGRAVTSLPESIWAVAQHRERSQRQRRRSATWLLTWKLVCLAALIIKIVYWTETPQMDVVVRSTVTLAATILAWSLAAANRYGSMAMFAAIAFLFNPFIPVLTFAGVPAFALTVASASALGLSLTLQPKRPAFARRG